MNKLPTVAAIANYNMANELQNLLPQVAEQGYDAIFVLDDASTDHSRDVVSTFGGATFVAGAENKGAGANRNRIVPALGFEATIHFLDADVDLRSDRMAERVQEVLPSDHYGFVGGMALTPNGMQSVWNYGPRQGLRAMAGALVQLQMESQYAQHPERAMAIRKRLHGLLKDWPNPLETPVRRPVFWNIEQSLVVDSRTFAQLGGFDENLREHEIQDLAIRMANRGLMRVFDPSIVVQHTEGQVRNYNRSREMHRAELYIARKHGLRYWLRAGRAAQ